MKTDRVINSIPLTVGPHINGYWIVRNMTGTGCEKCAFYKGGSKSDCPTIYMENTNYDVDTGEGPKPERDCPLCIAFGDTAEVYFAEVTDDEIN